MAETNAKETKIVKATPKKTESQTDEQPRVTVKAAVIPQTKNQGQSKQTKTQQSTQARPAHRPPLGKPVANKELEGRTKPPVGKVVVPKEVVERGQVKEEPAVNAEKAKIQAEIPAAQAHTAETPATETHTSETNAAETRTAQAPAAEKPAARAPEAEKPAAETRTAQAPAAEAAKAEKTASETAPKADAPKTDAPKADAPKTDAPKTDAPKADAPKADAPKTDVPKTDAPKAQQSRSDSGSRSDRPQRQNREDGRSNQGSRSDRGERGTRPQRQDNRGDRNDRSDRSDRGDRNDRSDRNDRYDRSPRGDRNDRSDRNDRNDRSPRSDRNDRNDRGPRGDRQDRPQRDGRDGQGSRDGNYRDNRDRDNRDRDNRDRDNRDNRDNRGDRGGSGDRGARREKNDGPKYDRLETKPYQKNAEKREHHDKERNKFAKLEGGSNTSGKKNKEKIQQRSLEKAVKPKKHNKPKPVTVEEEDIMEELPTGTIAITVPITVAGLCEQAGISTSQVIMALMKMGIMANINQNIDEDTVLILADELGLNLVVAKVEEEELEEGLELFEDSEEDLKPRAPIITVMGHVDHGKTSLLDAIRKTNVTVSEAGGITQHIGASEVTINGQKIVFLDTPGHEAFTAMRARGAHITDIAVLVVAADDSVKPQTVESISHAKAAGVPIIVAINKIDKPGANPERVKQDLTEYGILVEDWGGDVISVPVSAKTGEGIVNLLEMILLQAEVLELKANPSRLAMGSVIEARLDKNKGPVATLLVTNGTLRSGMSVVAGTCSGRIRLMTNYKGDTIKKAGPATAVEILGLTDVPEAGDEFNAVKEDKLAREIAENRKAKLRDEILARNASTTLEQLFSQIQEGEVKDLNLIIKGDVQGSIGAIVSSLEKLNNENVRVKIIHTGVGTVTESDVMLAGTTGSIIIGFNVRPTTAVQSFADRENIQIRLYRVIYDIINDVEDAMKGMLDPEFKEEVLGKIQVRETFKVPNVGIIAGAYVQEGKVVRNAEVRLVRDGIVIHEGKISSLKRFKDDAKEVNQGYECGIGIENYNDIKEGDIIECFHMVEVERK